MAFAWPAPRIEPLGECALLLGFGDTMDNAVNDRVHAAAHALRAAHLPGVRDIAPAYATLALYYDPGTWQGDTDGFSPWQRLADAALQIASGAGRDTSERAGVVDIPVHYGGVQGPDLSAVAKHAGLDAAEVVARHLAGEYRVAMIGFAPGFAYLSGLDPALACPRRETPRVRVPAGSVAIGGLQTGIYPSELPGGWQIIGCTSIALFDAAREPPSLLTAGDRVRFSSIDS